jgi:sulfur carrier protein
MITVNGEQWHAEPGMTVADVVARLTAEPRGIAVALDGAVVPRVKWAATEVADQAQIEVLTAVQGG